MDENAEQSSDVKIEDIEKILDKDFTVKGSAELAISKLNLILSRSRDPR